jgi:hypothetical protein
MQAKARAPRRKRAMMQRKYQHLLRKMSQDQRLADRRALLFLD